MSAELTQCPKCGGPTKAVQVNLVQRKECDHCGPLPFGTNVKTNEAVQVKR